MRMIKHHTFVYISALRLMSCVFGVFVCVYDKTVWSCFGSAENSPRVSAEDREYGQRGGDWGGARISPPSKYNGLRKGTCYE